MLTDDVALAVGLSRAAAWLRQHLQPQLEALHGLGYTDFLLLSELASVRGRRLRPVDLAKRLLLTPSGVTRALVPLERAGWVQRLPHERDGRAGYASLTAAGERRLAEATPTVERVVASLAGEHLSTSSRLALVGFFERAGYTSERPDYAKSQGSA